MPTQTLSIIGLVVSGIAILWLTVITLLFAKQQQFFKDFTKNITKKDLKTLLKSISASLQAIDKELESQSNQIQNILKDNRLHMQKVGFIRFNPFNDTGGDQSFCLCLLDQKNSGIVITSLHSREQTRTYAKHIKEGNIQDLHFSKEEEEAYNQAVSKG